jgi:uncharacterized protein (TIGR02001 family)
MNALQRIAGGAAAAFAALMLAAPAYADGMRGSIKDAPQEQRRCTPSANIALTSEYVFRGFSQTREGPAVQGGFDLNCGMFYTGVWASSLDWSDASPDASIEIDAYAGMKFTTGRIAWDLGVIYYDYPKQRFGGPDANYVELKVGASTEVWKGGTIGTTVFYSPDYQYNTGQVWTVETSFAQALPAVGRFSPTFSALVGYQVATSDKANYIGLVTDDDDHYLYWNAGVTFAFDKNWSFDVRYWDTNISKGASCGSGTSLFACDERVVGTLKFTY